MQRSCVLRREELDGTLTLVRHRRLLPSFDDSYVVAQLLDFQPRDQHDIWLRIPNYTNMGESACVNR